MSSTEPNSLTRLASVEQGAFGLATAIEGGAGRRAGGDGHEYPDRGTGKGYRLGNVAGYAN
jgi:hypothetical protein